MVAGCRAALASLGQAHQGLVDGCARAHPGKQGWGEGLTDRLRRDAFSNDLGCTHIALRLLDIIVKNLTKCKTSMPTNLCRNLPGANPCCLLRWKAMRAVGAQTLKWEESTSSPTEPIETSALSARSLLSACRLGILDAPLFDIKRANLVLLEGDADLGVLLELPALQGRQLLRA